MLVEKYQRLVKLLLRITTYGMLSFSVLVIIMGLLDLNETVENTLFIIVVTFIGAILLATMLFLIVFIIQAISKKIEMKEVVMICLTSLATIPILWIFSFIIIIILFLTTGFPPQD